MADTRSDVAAELVAWHRDARRRTLELVAALDDRQLMGPRLAIVNPMRWEVGHVAWFQEFWALRRGRRRGDSSATRGETSILRIGETSSQGFVLREPMTGGNDPWK